MECQGNTCEAEYAKDPKIKKDDINSLEEWVEKLPHMPKIPEYMLIQLYHASEYSLQRAKALADLYYRCRNTAPELFLVDKSLKHRYLSDYWETLYCILLPKTTPEGYRIVYLSFRDPALFFGNDLTLKIHVRNFISMVLTYGICPGVVVIYDMKDYSLQHAADLNFNFLKKYITFFQDAAPMKLKQIYVVNGYSIVDKLYRLITPMLRKEVAEMVHIQSDINEFFKLMSKDYFPRDFGGTLPHTRDELNEQMKNQVISMCHLVDEELLRKTDESNRTDKKTDTLFEDCNASFRKLDVD